jgi:sulfur-oxidizing protein SoxA
MRRFCASIIGRKLMKFKKLITVVLGALAIPFAAIAGEDSQLTVEGQLMVTSVAAPAHMENVDEIFSGWVFR